MSITPVMYIYRSLLIDRSAQPLLAMSVVPVSKHQMEHILTHLSLQEFQACTSTSTDMAEFPFFPKLGNNRCSVTTSDDHCRILLNRFFRCLEEFLRSL